MQGVANIILALAVLLLVVCVFQLVSQGQTPAAPNNHGAGSRDTSTPPGTGDSFTVNCSAHLEHFRSQLIQSLCHTAWPGPAGGSGCKLCPSDWRLHGDKCYWVSRDSKTWSESRTDCSARGSRLVVIRDREELAFLKHLTRDAIHFWVGLSVLSPEKAWVWLDGSQLDPTLSPVPGQAQGNSCGVVKGYQINSESCSSAYPWICQRDAIPL